MAGAWLQPRPKPTAQDALTLAHRALRAAGVPSAPGEAADVVAGVYDNADAGEHLDVWHVDVSIVGAATIEIDVDRATGGLVQLDDVVDGRYVLTDAQAQAVHDFNGRFPTLDDRLRRNFAAAAAGLFAAAIAVCFTLFAPRRSFAQRDDLPPPRA